MEDNHHHTPHTRDPDPRVADTHTQEDEAEDHAQACHDHLDPDSPV